MIPVEGHKNLFRDENTGAIVNCDVSGYEQYIKMKSERQKQKDEIKQIKSDLDEVKSMLRELLNGTK